MNLHKIVRQQIGKKYDGSEARNTCAGKLHARFDEGGQEILTTARLLRHRQTKEAATDRLGLRDADSCFLLYPIFADVRKRVSVFQCTPWYSFSCAISPVLGFAKINKFCAY